MSQIKALTLFPREFETKLAKNPYLISFDLEDPNKRNELKLTKAQKILQDKKAKDSLNIKPPEKPKRPIEISKHLKEEEKEIPISDLGIQSDPIDYIDPTKEYIPQKLGKDIGTQVEDGELFNFDIDVEPILAVLTGKILEQAQLEIDEDEEIKILRETKVRYYDSLQQEQIKINEVEKAEIKRQEAIVIN